MAEILICRPLCELDALTTEQCMTNKAYLQQDGMFMKLSMARTIAQHVWINYNKLGKIAYHVKNLPEIFYSKSRARLSHAMALHNCKQLQEWIKYKNTWTIPLERWHGILQNTCRAHAQKMHRLNDTKMTNLQVLIRTRE